MTLRPPCPKCGSYSVQKKGTTACGYQRYRCHCGAGYHDSPQGVVCEAKAAPKPPGKLERVAGDGEYQSMLSQKPGKPNVPMLNRSREVGKLFGKLAELLDDLGGLDPKDAASMVDKLELRDYSGSRHLGEWWSRFADACEVRRAAETPSCVYRPRLSEAKWRNNGGC